tara:strand:- start:1803 stop:2303 length:501 start_codon:yes stop_codon:yes gene_type:complete
MEQLITIGLLNIGDEIKFMFKKNMISGVIGYGGHVLNTIIHCPKDIQIRTLYTRSYPSLTAWSEACLREGLQEENTRYASWKRVIHVKTGRTLQSLRSQLNVSTKMVGASRQDLFAEINRLQMKVAQLTQLKAEPRDSASVTDQLLMSPSVIKFFREWEMTSSLRG